MCCSQQVSSSAMYPAGKQAGHLAATACTVPLCMLRYFQVAMWALFEGAWHHVQICTKQLVKQLELLLYGRQQQGL